MSIEGHRVGTPKGRASDVFMMDREARPGSDAGYATARSAATYPCWIGQPAMSSCWKEERAVLACSSRTWGGWGRENQSEESRRSETEAVGKRLQKRMVPARFAGSALLSIGNPQASHGWKRKCGLFCV
eukprot:3163723-Rhodomonas_salina.3